MDVEMRFKNAGRDAIGYLTAAGAPDDGGVRVKSTMDYEFFVRDGLGATNRQREIFIVDSMETARTVAMMARCTSYGDMAISEISGGVYAVSLTHINGNYDDGIPLIVDLREHGSPLTLVGELQVS